MKQNKNAYDESSVRNELNGLQYTFPCCDSSTSNVALTGGGGATLYTELKTRAGTEESVTTIVCGPKAKLR